MENQIFMILSIIVSAVIWLRYIRKEDKYEPEPLMTVLRVGLTGGFISTMIAGFLNVEAANFLQVDIGNTQNMSSMPAGILSTFIGFNEEFNKAIATIFLVRNLKDLNEPVDAIVYSTAVGLGFAFIENFSYSMQYGFINLVMRSVTAMPLHIGLAALWGYKIADAKFVKNTGLFREMFPMIITASLIHALYDYLIFTINNPLVSLSISLVTGVILVKFIKRKLIELAEKSPFKPRNYV